MVHLNLYSTGTATGLYLMSETGTNVKTYIGYTQEMIRRIAEVLQAVFLDGRRGVNCSLQVNCSLFFRKRLDMSLILAIKIFVLHV